MRSEKMYYFGLLKGTKTVEIFNSKNKPTTESHGDLYGYVFGGYKTKQEAVEKANYQFTYSHIVVIDNRKKKKMEANRNVSRILAD
jgi:hypothetical protein